MTAKNHLNPEQVEKLQKVLKDEENGTIRERVLILLLLNDGKTQAKIAEFVGCSINTVCYWCVHGDPDNLASLKDERMKGNHRKATDKYIEILLETVDKEPADFGYAFGRWTGERLAKYLEEVTGIKLSGSQVRRILVKKKYVYIWAKYSLEVKREPEKRSEFKQKLTEYLRIEKENPKLLQVWFWDESGVSLRVIKRKNWCKKGVQRQVRGDRRKGNINVMGGVRNSDKKRFVEFLNKGNSENFYRVIKLFYQELISEWVEAGNKAEEFATIGPKIVIILDNASFHKKEEYLEIMRKEMPNIYVEFLPTYSPDYNLMELVWHSAKEYIAHRLFKSIEELECLLHNLLNEGQLIIKWERNIKNKGNACITV